MPSKAKQYKPHPTSAPAAGARASRHERGYDSRWSKFAKSYLLRHPLCVMCKDRGRIVTATCVDHVDGLGPRGARGFDETNLRALCARCHSRKTVLEDGGFGRKPKAKAEGA